MVYTATRFLIRLTLPVGSARVFLSRQAYGDGLGGIGHMWKWLALLTTLLLAISLFTGCSASRAPAKTPDGKIIIKIGAFMVPHSEILEGLKPLAEQDGLSLEIVEFTDPMEANQALANRELDVSYVQSAVELKRVAAEHKLSFVSLGAVHMEPLLLVSTRAMAVNEIGPGARIAIPNDADRAGRALRLLSEQGLLALKAEKGTVPTMADITENHLNLQLVPKNETDITDAVLDHDAVIMSGVQLIFAKEALKIGIKNLAPEQVDGSEFAAVVVVRKGEENRPEIQTLMKVLQSDQTRLFIKGKYKGMVGPAF